MSESAATPHHVHNSLLDSSVVIAYMRRVGVCVRRSRWKQERGRKSFKWLRYIMFNIKMTLKTYGACVEFISVSVDVRRWCRRRTHTHTMTIWIDDLFAETLLSFPFNPRLVFWHLTYGHLDGLYSPVKYVFLDAVQTDLAQCRREFDEMQLKWMRKKQRGEKMN